MSISGVKLFEQEEEEMEGQSINSSKYGFNKLIVNSKNKENNNDSLNATSQQLQQDISGIAVFPGSE